MTNNNLIIHKISLFLENPDDEGLKVEIDAFRASSLTNKRLFEDIERLWLLSPKTSLLESFSNDGHLDRFTDKLLAARQADIKKLTWFRKNTEWVAAAVILICFSLAYKFYIDKEASNIDNASVNTKINEVGPGGNKAFLILGDGSKISLTDANTGNLVTEAGLAIRKTSGGEVVYEVIDTHSNSSNDNKTNTIETPIGGTWHVRLPDGTNVWLNAQSSITYPVNFSTKSARFVELSGEAYFEVAEDKSKPFFVKSDKQQIEVLGTHFNVSSYSDEIGVKTTLFEGRVSITILENGKKINLLVGEQSTVDKDGIKVVKLTDTKDVIDWKNGYFLFDNLRQEDIMKRLSRWYNIEIQYADAEAKEVVYYGIVSKDEDLSKVLKKFELVGDVRFVVSKNKVVLHKRNK
jgi:transmembrane sensor